MQTHLRTLTVACSLGIALLLAALTRAETGAPARTDLAIAEDVGISPPWVSGRAQADGTFRLQVDAGSPAGTLVIEVSTNLTSWSPVCTNSAATNPLFYTDPDAGKSPMRFYRAYRTSADTATGSAT